MIFGEGSKDATWAVVGEAPGLPEQEANLPFRGISGALLRQTLEKVGLDPEDGYLTYVSKIRPPAGRAVSTIEMKEQLPNLAHELNSMPNLEVVLVLGNVPLQALTGTTGITKRRGLRRELRKEFGPIVPFQVFATLSPNAVANNQKWYNGWLEDLASFRRVVDPPEDDITVVYVNGNDGFIKFTEAIGPAGALDIETTIGNPFVEHVGLKAVGFAFDMWTAWVFKPGPYLDRAVTLVQDVKWTMHNGLFDTLYLWQLMDWLPYLEHDTMALQYLLDPDERKGLEILSSIHLGMAPYKQIDYDNIDDEPWEAIYLMNGRDCVATNRLFRPLADQINDNPMLLRTYRWLLMPALRALTQVTKQGVPIDMEGLKRLTLEWKEKLAASEAELDELTPTPGGREGTEYPKGWPKGIFNPRSSKQVGHVLFDAFELPVTKYTPKGGRSTDESVLIDLLLYSEEPATTWIRTLRTQRKAQKLLSAYLESWPKNISAAGRMHPRYKPLHVVTGRLSSEQPNIQQVPQDNELKGVSGFRAVFGGVDGYTWIKADLSQIELRIAAWVAQEEEMIRALKAGEDLHTLTAERVLGDASMRKTGKILNFGLLYGAYPAKLREIAAKDYNVVLSMEEATRYHKDHFEAYPGLLSWHKAMEREIRATGIAISPLGRVRMLPDAFSHEFKTASRAVREGINHPIQSFASDMMLMSLVRVNEELPGLVIATVHDELDLLVKDEDVPFVVKRVQSIMEDVSWLSRWGIDFDIPVLAEVTTGRYWDGT